MDSALQRCTGACRSVVRGIEVAHTGTGTGTCMGMGMDVSWPLLCTEGILQPAAGRRVRVHAGTDTGTGGARFGCGGG